MGTVQFRAAVVEAARLLNEHGRTAVIPQAKPLSPGEVLGCTAPSGLCGCSSEADTEGGEDDGAEKKIKGETVMLFLADGRFHLEAAMISNPSLRALRYDPYGKTLTDQRYDTKAMKMIRRGAIAAAGSPDVKLFGIVLGTLGRQGNPGVLAQVRDLLSRHGKDSFVLLLSEIFPRKLSMFPDVDVWVQVACPRLSVDWGHHFSKPLLNPFELHVAMGEASLGEKDVYPMDYYRRGGGKWTNYHDENKFRKIVVP